MGLDVYLYWYDNIEDAEEIEEGMSGIEADIWEEGIENLNKEPGMKLTDDERKEISRKVEAMREKMIPDSLKKGIDFPSPNHPDHLFRIGYFRSSYNQSGINNILNNLIDKDLYYIFKVDDHEYHIKPNWTESLARAKEVKEEFINAIKSNNGFYVCTVGFNPFIATETLPKSESDVLKAFLQSYSRFGIDGSYTNRDGEFYPKGMTIYAAIPAMNGSTPAVGLVLKDDDNRYDSYISSLDIVIETIEWVLSQEDPQNYVLHWSA